MDEWAAVPVGTNRYRAETGVEDGTRHEGTPPGAGGTGGGNGQGRVVRRPRPRRAIYLFGLKWWLHVLLPEGLSPPF